MKIVIASDLHIDNGLHPINWTDADVAIIAGDCGNSARELLYVADWISNKYNYVIMVTGNHEHYNNPLFSMTVEDNIKQIRDNLPSNVHLLERDSPKVTIDDVTFIGCNGWYSFDAAGEPSFNRKRFETWSDHRIFKNINQEQPWDRALNDANMIYSEVDKADGKIVVVTHTLPHRSLVSWSHDLEWNFNNSFFVNTHMSKVMEDFGDKISLWCAGHTHDRYDKIIHGVQCIVNPLGYKFERDGNWEPVLYEI